MTRGDLYLMLVPFSDGSGVKLRPCVILSPDEALRQFDDVTIAPVTSQFNRLAPFPTHVPIDVATPDGLATGLLHTSLVRCDKITTLHRSLMRRKIGAMPPAILGAVDRAIARALGI